MFISFFVSQELKTPWNNLLQGGNGQGQNQGSKLTFSFGSQLATNGKFWSPDRKFWSPTYFMYNLHKDTILNVTLHPRKVTTEVGEKTIETTRVKLSYKATVVRRWYDSGPKVMVVSIVILNEAKHKMFYVRGFHSETNTGPWVFSLCYFYEIPFFIFDLLSSTPFAAPAIPLSEEAAETIWRAMNALSTCRSTFNFFDYLVIFRHYFTGDGKVSCILATISDWFPNIKI